MDLASTAAGGGRLPLLDALARQWRTAVDAGRGREDISAADWPWKTTAERPDSVR